MTTKETVAVDDGLKPHTKHLKRAVTEDDILRLLDIRIMRISKFDSNSTG
jgi:topoisomerase-4 subunit A